MTYRCSVMDLENELKIDGNDGIFSIKGKFIDALFHIFQNIRIDR